MATVFIPAKGGSSRIKRKNMVDLGGCPLIWWTLQACRKWSRVDEVYVATEDKEIAEYSISQGASIYELEENDINDQRTASQLWQEFCKDRRGDQLILYITNPFRKILDLEKAWRSYKEDCYDVVISVREEKHMIWKPNYQPLIGWQKRMTRRTQHCKPFFIADGSFYISSAEYVSSCRYFEQGKVLFFPVGRMGGIEIDDAEDLELARIVANGVDWWNQESI